MSSRFRVSSFDWATFRLNGRGACAFALVIGCGLGCVDGSARIVEVLAQTERTLVGQLNWRGRHPYVDSLATDFRGKVSLDEWPEAEDGDVVRVAITGEGKRGLEGRVVERVARGGDRDVLNVAIATQIAAYDLPDSWPEAVLEAAGQLPRAVRDQVPSGREDLRELPLVTIDGETAKDFDDAVFAEPRGSGWRLVVAIADVAHYVKKGGALDQEAQDRGNSVYLPQTVLPMLPEKLSNDLCSLRPRVPRYALAVDMQITAQGEVEEFRFFEAVIRSWQRLTYNEVGRFLEGEALDVQPEVAASLGELHTVYRALRAARDARGGLDFETREVTLDIDAGRVQEIRPVVRHDAHRLIEEAMIAANVCAAMFVECEHSLSLYRVHDKPDVMASQELVQAFAMAGIKLKQPMTPAALQQAADAVAQRPDAWVFSQLMLRAMQQAEYRPGNCGHFGLALERYMHFTSPIRRYADLVVHRTIKSLLKKRRRQPYGEETLSEIGSHISAMERRAEQAERAVEAWLKCDYLADRVGETFAGLVAAVTEFGLFVELDGVYVQGLLHISGLGQDYFRFETAELVPRRGAFRPGLSVGRPPPGEGH